MGLLLIRPAELLLFLTGADSPSASPNAISPFQGLPPRKRRILSELEFACLARVIHKRREKHGFLLTAWVFLVER